jgi:histone H3
LDILGHDGNTLCVDGTQVGIFEKTHQVRFGGFLEGQDGRSLESEITLEILGNLTNQTLEGKLSDEEVGTLLVPTDLAKGDGSGSVSVGFLDASGGGGRLTSSLGGKLFARGLSSGGLAGGLLD